MHTLMIWLIVILVPLSLVAGLIVRRDVDESFFSTFVALADSMTAFIGLFLALLTNASMTNQFAKYEEGFPNVDTGGLPGVVMIVNLAIFFSPLIALGVGRRIRRWNERRADRPPRSRASHPN